MRILGIIGDQRQILMRGTGFALLLAAAACSTGPRLPPPIAAAVPTVVAPPSVTAARIPEAQQNRVALLVPVSGANAAVGQSIANAANMAMLDLGNTRINLRVYDTANGGAAAAANRALGDGAGLLLGPLLAGDVRAVLPIAGARGVPVVSFSNDASLAGGGAFVMGFQSNQSIARVVAYARAAGVQRFAALVPAGAYGQRASSAFLRAVEAGGGRVVAVTPYSREPARLAAAARTVTGYDARMAKAGKTAAVRADGSVAPVSSRVAPVPFQALLIADSGAAASAFVPPLAQYGAPPGTITILGTELWGSEAAVRHARGLNGALFAAVPQEQFDRLASRYRAKFGGAPSRLASFGYDAVLLVNSLAGRWELGRPFPRGLLTTADGFAGVDGAFRFNAAGIAERALAVQRVGPGTIATVSPAPRGF